MPEVKGKHYPYTKEGIAAAEEAAAPKNMAYWKENYASTPNKFFDMSGMMGGMMGGGGDDATSGTEFTTTDTEGMTENVDESKQSKASDQKPDAGGGGGGGGGDSKGPKVKYDLNIHGARWNP